MFCEEKVAQMAAYLLHKRGERMAYLKLMKLLYLADRVSMNNYGYPITGDRMVSMPKGPVLSQTLNLITGDYASDEFGWGAWIKSEKNYEISLRRKNVTRDDFESLSEAELGVLDVIWRQFGHMSRFDIVEYTHKHCTEWQDPDGSSYPISPSSVFIAVGKSPEVAEKLARELIERQQLDCFLQGLR
ncbi:Panacea domain-containing protein [Photorhabdus viridis]|uniref:Panacea domain-containing protein n=1 Tax=Photorhabdus viridis TaxID=3163327 RepID=UPI003307A1C4